MSADPEHSSLYSRGWELFRLNRYEDAIKTFLLALQRKPEDAWTLCGLSAVYYAQGDWKSALRFADQAVQAAPDDREGHRRRSLCLLEMDRKEEALAAAREAVRLAPENPDCLIPLSMSLRALRRLDEAEQAADKLLEVAPEKTTAYQELALVYMDQKRFADAAEMNRKGLAIDPEDADLINNLAVALEGLGKKEEALQTYYLALQRNPGSKTARRNLIKHLELCGYATVEEFLRTQRDPALAEEMTNRSALIAEAAAFSKAKQHPKAIQLLSKAIQDKPDDVPLYNALSEAYRQQGDGWNTLHVATQAVRANVKDWRAHQWRAWVMLEMSYGATWVFEKERLRQDALASAQEAVRLSQERFICLDTLFRIQVALSLLAEAEQSALRMLETEPNWWRSYLKMGQLFRQKNDLEEAEQWYRQAAERKPDSAEALHEVGLVLRDRKKLTEAESWFRRALELEPTNTTYRRNAAEASPRKKWFGRWQIKLSGMNSR